LHVLGLPGAFRRIDRRDLDELSPKAGERLRWVSAWQALISRGLTTTEASHALGLPRSTLYRWHKCLKVRGPKGLEDGDHSPRRRRTPTWSPELAQAVLLLREHYPRWGKDKLVVLLRRQGWQVSTSMVGRILSTLKQRGVLKEPPRNGVSASRRQHHRPYAIRKPRDYRVTQPGDLVQVDTLDLRPLPGVVLKHFTARDVICRWDVIEAHTRATAATAANFLDALLRRMPFPVKALQVDGGSEFHAAFEQACQNHGIRLFVLPPRSPKLNGHVERAHRTHIEEFYDVYDGDFEIEPLNQALSEWETIYNQVRPHQALDSKTPEEYLGSRHPASSPKPHLSHMY
jgi:putative transposase